MTLTVDEVLHLDGARELDACASGVGGNTHVRAARQHEARQLHVVVVHRVMDRSATQTHTMPRVGMCEEIQTKASGEGLRKKHESDQSYRTFTVRPSPSLSLDAM